MAPADPEPAAAAAPASGARRYSAFISYTHADRRIAERLQARLERYRLPRRLAERVGFRRIKPIAMDRDEMPAAPDLSEAIMMALEASDYLIVVCTPRTPGSAWVGKEIDAFRAMRGDTHILAAVFEGDDLQCFHPRLLARGDGAATQPLAPDFRKQADGPRLGLLKLIAALAGVGVDELAQRDAQRRMRQLAALSAVAVAIALSIAGTSYLAYSARVAADREREASARSMQFQLGELRDRIKAGGTLDMAAALNRGVELYYDERSGQSHPLDIELRRAELLQAKAEDLEKRGDLAGAAANARQAWAVSARLRAEHPDLPDVLYAHAQSAYWVGAIAWRQGDTPLAANAFGRYADLTAQLVQRDPGKADWRLEAGYANSNLGSIALREARDLMRAERYFRAAQGAFQAAARDEARKSEAMYELADGEAWLADVARLRGDLVAAGKHRERQQELLTGLLAADPRNLLYRIDRVSNRLGMARLASARGDRAGADAQLRAALAEAGELQSQDPANASVGSQKRAIELFLIENALNNGAAVTGVVGGAGQAPGDCEADRKRVKGEELATFCSLLAARIELRRGNAAEARRILAAPWLARPLAAVSLSPSWRIDFAAECRALGVAGVCAGGGGQGQKGR